MRLRDKLQGESLIELAAIVAATAREAGDAAANLAGARELARALRTSVKERPRARLPREGKCVAPRFIADAEIVAGLPPFGSMRRDATATATSCMCDEMRQLVAERAVDLSFAVLAEQRIKGDDVASEIGAAGGGAETRVPDYLNERHELNGSDIAQHLARLCLEVRITACRRRRIILPEGRLAARLSQERARDSVAEKLELLKQQHTCAYRRSSVRGRGAAACS